MSKSLENEYKNLIVNDIPDLWDRIESQLEDRLVNNVDEITTAINASNEEIKQVQETLNNRRKKEINSRFYIKYMGPIAAAAVLMVLVIPTVLSVVNKNGFGGKKSDTMNMTLSAPMAEEAIMYEAESFDYEEATDGFYDTLNQAKDYTAGESIMEDSLPLASKQEEKELVVENVAFEVISVEEAEDGALTLVCKYKETRDEYQKGMYLVELDSEFSATVSIETNIIPEVGQIYSGDLYEQVNPDGSTQFEVVVQSLRR